ncbi:kelch-like protein 18 [Orussus abietinus]|uniref:kelch-like protein 18 n=1 Tax=Orussus abietinus TaxID=222816 RepID=UPI0006252A0B|nr:kelch-like protein 18 [Orussus abietinus]
MGYIYAKGGRYTDLADALEGIEVYDSDMNRWDLLQFLTGDRISGGRMAAHGDKLYVMSYDREEGPLFAEVYCCRRNTWTSIAPMQHRRMETGTASLGEYLYVCGGFHDSTTLDTVERYSPERNQWEEVEPMTRKREDAGVEAFRGCIYVLGGHGKPDGPILDSVERFDPRTESWREATPMLSRRCMHGAAVLNGKLYACGGFAYENNVCGTLGSVEVYDPVADRWQFVAPMNERRGGLALVANAGKLWAIGGSNDSGYRATVEVYDPEADSWSFDVPLSTVKGGIQAAVIADELGFTS